MVCQKAMMVSHLFFSSIYRIVQKIPRGNVATYGQIAALAGSPRGARTVGWALHCLRGENLRRVPWHRVINREGKITACHFHSIKLQLQLLLREGIDIQKKNGDFWIDLKKYLWNPYKK